MTKSARALRLGLAALWFGAIPALLAGHVLRALLPAPKRAATAGVAGTIGRIASEDPVLIGAVLFVAFALVARYWGKHLPGGRHLAGSLGGDRVATARRRWLGTAVFLGLAVLGAIVVRASFFQAYRVTSSSMLPLFEPGDQVLGNRSAFGLRLPGLSGPSNAPSSLPRRGDVVVFRRVIDGREQELVKRVIGLPGDRVRVRGGIPSINGWRVPACDAGRYYHRQGDEVINGRLALEFLEDQVYLSAHAVGGQRFDEYEVKSNELFVLGDNRSSSRDSRNWNAGQPGGVPLSMLEARADRWFFALDPDGRVDFASAFRTFALRHRLDRLDGHEIETKIRECLAKRPKDTRPPAPGHKAPISVLTP